MLRFLFSIGVIIAAIWVTLWFAGNPGEIAIDWLGYRIITSPAIFVAMLALGAVLLTLFLGFLWWLMGIPTRFRHRRDERKASKGLSLLTESLTALSAGNHSRSRKTAEKAHKLLEDNPLGLLLAAQASYNDGDPTSVIRYYAELSDKPATAFIGHRGLMQLALRQHDYDEALKHANEALKVEKTAPVIHTQIISLHIRKQQWQSALDAIKPAVKYNALTNESAARHRAAIHLCRAREKASKQNWDNALSDARKSIALHPAFPAALEQIVECHLALGNKNKAAAAIEKYWHRAHTSALAERYLNLIAEVPAEKRLKRVEKATSSTADQPVSMILRASAAVDARAWEKARSYLRPLFEEDHHTANAAVVMARIERDEMENFDGAERWLEKAAKEYYAPGWDCSKCGTRHKQWEAFCHACDALLTINWQETRADESKLLPLIAEKPGHGDTGEFFLLGNRG